MQQIVGNMRHAWEESTGGDGNIDTCHRERAAAGFRLLKWNV